MPRRRKTAGLRLPKKPQKKPSTATQQQFAYFNKWFELPLEIRFWILRFLLPTGLSLHFIPVIKFINESLYLTCRLNWAALRASVPDGTAVDLLKKVLNYALVSHQFKEEASSVLFGENHFIFTIGRASVLPCPQYLADRLNKQVGGKGFELNPMQYLEPGTLRYLKNCQLIVQLDQQNSSSFRNIHKFLKATVETLTERPNSLERLCVEVRRGIYKKVEDQDDNNASFMFPVNTNMGNFGQVPQMFNHFFMNFQWHFATRPPLNTTKSRAQHWVLEEKPGTQWQYALEPLAHLHGIRQVEMLGSALSDIFRAQLIKTMRDPLPKVLVPVDYGTTTKVSNKGGKGAKRVKVEVSLKQMLEPEFQWVAEGTVGDTGAE